MFARHGLAALSALALAALATAHDSGAPCATGSLQCCNSVVAPDSASGNAILGLVGVAVGSVTGLVGVGCSPISVVGVGGGAGCAVKPVCCQDSSVGDGVGIGCVAVSL